MEDHNTQKELEIYHGIWDTMSISSTIHVLFVNCEIMISVIFLCSQHILYLAMVVKYALPLSNTRDTATIDGPHLFHI